MGKLLDKKRVVLSDEDRTALAAEAEYAALDEDDFADDLFEVDGGQAPDLITEEQHEDCY